ncbi:hypothetical protein UCRPC4_g01120 [Phaeomoniella chlamydospora]|uniref:Uncharacterized protein n=1 Tax=Phaeomoniella chlamydospora TaxID=158046 RepID=A0A0G2HFT4_PHACM|nr:hypothetical protein UCRPC4_g01120 [Phaeomoniella chlamydospora]
MKTEERRKAKSVKTEQRALDKRLHAEIKAKAREERRLEKEQDRQAIAEEKTVDAGKRTTYIAIKERVYDAGLASRYRHRHRLLKRQAKIEAALERRRHREAKAMAKAMKREERRRKRIEHDHRKEDERKDREDRQRVREAQRARRKSLKGVEASGALGALANSGHRAVDRPRRRMGHENAIRRAEEKKRQRQVDKRQQEYTGGIVWGFDPGLPPGGAEAGGPGRKSAINVKGMGLSPRNGG